MKTCLALVYLKVDVGLAAVLKCYRIKANKIEINQLMKEQFIDLTDSNA